MINDRVSESIKSLNLLDHIEYTGLQSDLYTATP